MASKLGTLTLDLVCRVGNFTQAMREASNSASREMGRIESSTSSAQSMLKSLAATAAATFTVSQIVNYADSYTGMVNKIKLVTENQSQLSIAMSDTHRIAQSTASEWGGVVDVYTKFQKISDRLGLSQKEVARVTETVTKAVGMSGASADEAQRALIQFSQGLSLGVLRGQDLNSVMQQTPALTDAIAKGMGVTSDKLKQMGADNILTTESIVEALKKVAASVDADFAETATLVSASFDLIKNEAIKMVGEFDAATGASSTFVKGMTELSENMDVVVGGLTVATAYMVGSYIPAIALGSKTLVVDTIAKVSSIAATRAKVLADYEVAKSNLAATAAMARSMGATNAQTAAMMANARAAYQQAAANKAAALSSATAFLGPVGLGIAVASVAAGYLLLKDNTEKSSVALLENSEYAKQATEELLKLEGAQKRGAEGELDKIIAKQTKEVAELTSQFNAQIIAIQNSNKGNEQVIEISNRVRLGVMKKADAFRELNKLKTVTPEQINKLEDLLKKLNTTNKTLKESELKAKSLATGINQIPVAAKDATTEVDKLNEKLKDFNKTIADRKYAAEYQIELITKFNKTPEQAAEMLKARLEANKAGLPAPTPEMLQSGLKALDYETKLKDATEARTKAIEEQNKQLKEQGKALQVNAKVQANAVKYDFAAIEKKYGLLNGLLSGIHMQESRGNGNAIGPMTKYGTAKGGFQFLDTTAKRFGLKGNDVFDIGKSADAAGQYLQYLYKKFGDWERAISAYHAGEGNVERGKNIGPINRQYVKNIKGYIAGASGQAFSTDYTVEDYLSDLEKADEAYKKFQKDQDALRQQFSSEDIIRNQERIDTIAKANELGLQHLIPKIEEYYKAQGQLAHLHHIEEVSGYKWSEEQKIAHTRLVDQQQLILSNQYTDAEKKIVNKAIDDRAAYELAIFNETQRRKAQELSDVLTEQQKQSSRNQLRFIAQATMNPSEYARWNLQNNMTDDVAYAFEDYEKNVNNINRKDEAGRFEIEDANIRNQLLQQAERTHQAKMLEIKEDYAAQAKDLAQSQYESQLSIWSSLLGQAQNTWSQMTQAVKDSEGEQSSAFKTMFLMQQSMAFASAIVSAHLAAVQTTADITLPFVGKVPAASAILAFGYANAGMIAGQTIAGMAHDGIDNVPREGTWLLDRGERVVDRRTNADLKDYLADRSKQGAQIVINNNSSANVRAQQGSDGKVYVTIDEVERYVNNSIQNPNSSISRTMSQNYNSQRRR